MQTNPTKLIVIPGHAAFKQTVTLPLPSDITQDELWVLQSFQMGEPPFYIEHIKKGIELADQNSLLIVSGGRTRAESGKFWSEAKTYAKIAQSLTSEPLQLALEEYARDSYQNLKYSVRKFKSLTGVMPEKVQVVGWAFKADRYKFHADTLGISDIFEYIGVNNPDANDLAGAVKGELSTLEAFKTTPLGAY